MKNRCPICNSSGLRLFSHHKNSPLLQNIIYCNKLEAKCAKTVDVKFLFCPECDFVFNPHFIESEIEYSEQYNNNQVASAVYRRYLDRLTDRIINDCRLHKASRILEIGCGNGYFLSLLYSKIKSISIFGFDPAFDGQCASPVKIKKQYFSVQGFKGKRNFDLIILRHCLESMLQYEKFLASLTRVMGSDSVLYIETPNLRYISKNSDFTLLYHEAARYYSLKSLQRLLDKYGLELMSFYNLFDGNYIGAFFVKRTNKPDFSKKIARFKKILSRHRRVIIWGVAGRAISLLTQMAWGEKEVKFGVDIDPLKQGKFIPVTGQKIISPKEAIQFKPDLVILSNNNYLREVRNCFKGKTTFLTMEGKTYE